MNKDHRTALSYLEQEQDRCKEVELSPEKKGKRKREWEVLGKRSQTRGGNLVGVLFHSKVLLVPT